MKYLQQDQSVKPFKPVSKISLLFHINKMAGARIFIRLALAVFFVSAVEESRPMEWAMSDLPPRLSKIRTPAMVIGVARPLIPPIAEAATYVGPPNQAGAVPFGGADLNDVLANGVPKDRSDAPPLQHGRRRRGSSEISTTTTTTTTTTRPMTLCPGTSVFDSYTDICVA